jgi:hypothetical protein
MIGNAHAGQTGPAARRLKPLSFCDMDTAAERSGERGCADMNVGSDRHGSRNVGSRMGRDRACVAARGKDPGRGFLPDTFVA